MNVALLIDAIVRQTMILVAQLATTAGMRAPLAHVANQVFLDLVGELQSQGVGQKIIADMFGMALRTYHAKVRRLSESATDRGKSLWEAILSFVQEGGMVSRADVLARFGRDDVMTVKGVLNDLVETGLVFKAGRGDRTAYRAASAEEQGFSGGADPVEQDAHMVWVSIYRLGGAPREQIAQMSAVEGDRLDAALAALMSDGRVVLRTDDDGRDVYSSDECVIPYGAPVGWEAAVFDHYQALVVALCTKLDQGETRADLRDANGGSTYGYEVWDGHPLTQEVLEHLGHVRVQASELRGRVQAYNDAHAAPPGAMRVLFYAGQSVKLDAGPEAEVAQ